MCLGNFLFLFKTSVLFIHQKHCFQLWNFSDLNFFKPLQSKGNYLSFYMSTCVLCLDVFYHAILYNNLFQIKKKKKGGKKWHMFQFASVISYLVFVFKSHVRGKRQQVSSITLDEKPNKPKYVFTICRHQNPNFINKIYDGYFIP